MVARVILCLLLLSLSSPAQASCLEKTVYAEARSEPLVGQLAVAHVILNRAKKYKKSVCTIVHQPGQFAVAGKLPKSFTVSSIGKDPTNGALYFHNTSVRRPMSWPRRIKFKIKIGNHLFYG